MCRNTVLVFAVTECGEVGAVSPSGRIVKFGPKHGHIMDRDTPRALAMPKFL